MIRIADNPSVRALLAREATVQQPPELPTMGAENSVVEPAPGYPAKSLTIVDGKYRAVDLEK
ncbi:hypothetical protein [Massilia alkalitolerans]|uniref:hypothetical protein n=1 Tax=Massilia alkalitolerans TaxID=286638 RepID=UPI00055B4BDD|nr:hypothetical protein [Massilia alkalitolerans]